MKHVARIGGVAAVVIACAGCRESSESREPKAQASASVVPSAMHSSAKPEALPVMTRVDPPAGGGAEGPNLFVATHGALLTWIEPTQMFNQRKPSIRLARFSKGSWTKASTVVVSDELFVNWADVPAAAEIGGRIFVAFPERRKDSSGYRAEIAISTDGGQSFQRRGSLHTDSSDTEHGFIAFAPENANSVRAFWLDGRATAQPPSGSKGSAPSMRLYTAVVGDSVTSEVLLDERTCDCCGLGVGRSDRGPVIAYRDRRDDEVRDISLVRGEGQGFSTPLSVHDDGYRIAGCPVNGPALAADGSRVAIAWYTYAGEQGRIKMAFSTDAGAHFAAPITIADSNGGVAPLGRVTVVWGDHGDALLGYVEAEREKARIMVRRVHADGSLHAPLVVAETRPERKSGFPKMVRLDDQLLVVWTAAESPSDVRAMLVPLAAVPREKEAAAGAPTSAERVVREGEKAPGFEVQTLEGKPISLASLAGKPVLVNLWASYCEPCRQELPVLGKIYKKYKKRGLEVVGIAMDERVTGEAMKKLAEKRRIEYAVWSDPEDRAGRALGVRVLPATFLVDRKGTIVLVRRGAVRDEDTELEGAIEKVL